MTATRWEYLTVPLLIHATKQILDNFGSEGWELVAILPGQQQASTPDPAERTALIEEIQTKVAEDLSTVPYLQGAQTAVSAGDVQGILLDASFKLRFAPITR